MSTDQITEELPADLASLIAESEAGKKSDETSDLKPADVANVDEPKVDPLVEKASKGGWTDKETWIAAGKDPDEWVDAKEFVARKPLYDKIHAQSRAIRERDQRIDAVTNYAARAAAAEREKVLAEIAEEKKQAFESGDYTAFDNAQKREQQVIAQTQQQAQQPAGEITMPAEVTDFAKRNELWFDKDQDMTEFAVSKAEKYVKQEGIPFTEALVKAEADVKRAFAHKFVNPNKEKPAAVAANNRETRGKSVTHADLNGEQRAVWSSLKKVMTFDEFVAGLRAQGELK